MAKCEGIQQPWGPLLYLPLLPAPTPSWDLQNVGPRPHIPVNWNSNSLLTAAPVSCLQKVRFLSGIEFILSIKRWGRGKVGSEGAWDFSGANWVSIFGMSGLELVLQGRSRKTKPCFCTQEVPGLLGRVGIVRLSETKTLRIWCHMEEKRWHQKGPGQSLDIQRRGRRGLWTGVADVIYGPLRSALLVSPPSPPPSSPLSVLWEQQLTLGWSEGSWGIKAGASHGLCGDFFQNDSVARGVQETLYQRDAIEFQNG